MSYDLYKEKKISWEEVKENRKKEAYMKVYTEYNISTQVLEECMI